MGRVRTLLELVKFEHTIFALPFAYLGVILAQKSIPPLMTWVWVTLAMVGARTAGMCLNRLIDQKIDAANPRTQNRPLQQQLLSPQSVWGFTLASIALLIYAASQLPPICLQLVPLALFLLTIYSYLKQFTWLCHFGVGLVLASAPIGGWLAVTGSFSWATWILGGVVLAWVAGFDIIYATQDSEFDKRTGLHSIPVTFGLPIALSMAKELHVIAALLLILLGILMKLTLFYWVGVAIAAAILYYEHRIICPTNLSRVNQAFFVLNGWVSTLLFGFTLLGLLLP